MESPALPGAGCPGSQVPRTPELALSSRSRVLAHEEAGLGAQARVLPFLFPIKPQGYKFRGDLFGFFGLALFAVYSPQLQGLSQVQPHWSKTVPPS